MSEADDGRIRVTVKTSLKGMKYWALQYLESVEVVGPADLREEVITMLKNNYYLQVKSGNH